MFIVASIDICIIASIDMFIVASIDTFIVVSIDIFIVANIDMFIIASIDIFIVASIDILLSRRRRRGFSAFRSASRQIREEVARLYRYANDTDSPYRDSAREKLLRWGFNFKRPCCLLQFEKMFVRVRGTSEVFPGVDYRDRMHGIILFLHRQFFETLDLIVWSAPHRRLLDQRLAVVCSRGFMVDGRVLRAQKTIFADTGMTASDKFIVMFYLSHVFGPFCDDTDILPRASLAPLLDAIAHAQLILLAVKGRRQYTVAELKIIFDRGFVTLFGALEQVRFIDANIELLLLTLIYYC